MKKEYIKPEAEMTKFVETEEIMAEEKDIFTASITAVDWSGLL